MNAKEKAKYLVKKFTEPTKVPNIKNVWVEDIDGAKQFALICVDEIINAFENMILSHKKDEEFWQEVKQEIQNL